MEIDWYNRNLQRSYPLRRVDGTLAWHRNYFHNVTTLAYDTFPPVLADAGFTLQSDLGFDPAVNSMQLALIVMRDDTIYFEFRPDSNTDLRCVFAIAAPTQAGDRTFQRVEAVFQDGPPQTLGLDGTTPNWAAESAGAPNYGDGWTASGQPYPEYGNGYIVVGDLWRLWSLAKPVVGDPITTSYLLPYIRMATEPAQVQRRAGLSVARIRLANSRTIVLPPACDQITIDDIPERDEAVSIPTALTGDVQLLPGYNVSIDLQPEADLITFSAGVGDGEGSPCEHDIAAEIFGDDLEYGYGYGSDELVLILKSCSELIASINGVRPDVNGRLNLRGAGAVRVTPDTTAHRIILDLTMPNIGCEDA